MSVPRDRLFAFAYLLLTLNALTIFVGVAVESYGWLGATLTLFDVSAIVWLAIAAGLALLWDTKSVTGPRRGDAAMVGAAHLPRSSRCRSQVPPC